MGNIFLLWYFVSSAQQLNETDGWSREENPLKLSILGM